MPLSVAARKKLVTNSLLSRGELTDDHLVELAREGDADALDSLLARYTSYARAKAKTYFLVGADREDIVQEGMIGLFKAIRDYDSEKTVSFRSFAELCITRQIITAIKGATRQKHGPLNSYVSLHRPLPGDDDDGDRQLVDFLAAARIIDPVEQVVAEDEVAQIRTFLVDILSDLEVEVLNLYLEGRSYQEIAASLRRQAKSIDNALQRIKRKLEQFLEERDCDAEKAAVVHMGTFAGNGNGSHGDTNGNGSHGDTNGNGHNGNGHHANGRAGRVPKNEGSLEQVGDDERGTRGKRGARADAGGTNGKAEKRRLTSVGRSPENNEDAAARKAKTDGPGRRVSRTLKRRRSAGRG